MDINKHEPLHEHDYKVYEFGGLPEIVGAIGVVLLIGYLINFARGSL